MGCFLAEVVLKTVLGSNHKAEKLSFSVLPSITLNLGSFGAKMGYLGSQHKTQKYLGPTHVVEHLMFSIFIF